MSEEKAYLVLDTNIWVYKTHLLSSGLGPALLFSLNEPLSSERSKILAIPEVIEEEIRKHVRKLCIESVKGIDERYDLIQQLMGSRDDYRVPSEEEFDKRIDSRVKELDAFRIEFTFAHAKGALQRILEELPPNGPKNQQFKDSAIWEAILDLAKAAPSVDFVTVDKDFFKDKDPALGLADNLRADCEKVPGRITVYYKLKSYLDTIKQEVSLLYTVEIVRKIHKYLEMDLQMRSQEKGYGIFPLLNHEVYLYLTEKPDRIAVDFTFVYGTYGFKHPETQQEIEAKEVVKGDCFYLIRENRVENVRYDSIQLFDDSGKFIPEYSETFETGEITIGRKSISYRPKRPLGGPLEEAEEEEKPPVKPRKARKREEQR